MTIPLIVLAILSAIGGFINLPHALGGHAGFAAWLNPILNGHQHAEVDASMELMLMSASVGVAIIGIAAAYLTYASGQSIPANDESINKSFLSRLVYNKFYVDEAYNLAIVQPLSILSYIFHFLVDYFIIDLAVNIVAKSVQVLGRGLRYIQSGSVSVYMFAMVAGIVLIITLSYFYLPLNQLTN